MNFRAVLILGIGLFAAGLTLRAAHSQDNKGASYSIATPDRWQIERWWPTKGTPSSREYVGPDECDGCHAEIAASQRTTPMFNAARRAVDSKQLQQHRTLSFSDGTFAYVISTGPFEAKAVATDATNTISAPIGWAFGAGEAGQTYVLKQNGRFLEGRLSYYPSLAGLDITPGHQSKAPNTIEHALGNLLDPETIRRCFGCHSTASTVSDKFDPEHAMLGVTCQACHGPGLGHVTAKARMNGSSMGTIFYPAQLSPVDSVDFCGACHRTPEDVAFYMPPNLGISTIRFQPYRLEKSRCWGTNGDARITCVACHDPHKPLEQDLIAYDGKCLQCHRGPGASPSAKLPACPVKIKNCVSCHMPKYDIPWAHATFTDHFIRIVRRGKGFPE